MYLRTVRTGSQKGTEIGDRHDRRADRTTEHAGADRRRGHAAFDSRSPAETSTRQCLPTRLITTDYITLIKLLRIYGGERAHTNR